MRLCCGDGFLPGGGGEIGEALDGSVGESWKYGGEVVADGEPEPAAAFDDREDRSDLRSGLSAAYVDPVFSANRYGAHGVLGDVVG